MSLVIPGYPPPRYTGASGEVSATLRRAESPADYQMNGVAYHYLATGGSTDGDFGLYRVELAPAAGGPGPHFHKTMSESFFVLAGTMRLFDGRDWVDGRAGDYLYVPLGGLHGFRNEADEPASILMVFAPGAPREQYFEHIVDLADMTDEQRVEFLGGHDNWFV